MGRYDLIQTTGQDVPDGDRGFNAVHLKLPREQLSPGYVARHENRRFSHGSVTRPGTRTPLFANLFSVSGRLLGSGIYSNPNAAELGLLAFTSGVVAIRSGVIPLTIPVQNSFTSAVEFTQHFDKVFAHQADPSQKTQVWDGLDYTVGFIEVADAPVGSDPGIVAIPNPDYSINYLSRAWFPVPGTRDQIGASDINNPGIYDSIQHAFRVNTGTADAITGIYPFFLNSLIVGKERSIDYFDNIAPDLGDSFLLAVEFGISPASAPPPRATVISTQIGVTARKSGLIAGGRFLFYSNFGPGGIYSVTLDQARTSYSTRAYTVDTTPVSDPIEPIMQRINPDYASGIVGQTSGIYAYWAVPLDGATFNNAVIVYNTASSQWEGVDFWNALPRDFAGGVTQTTDNPIQLDNIFPMNFYGTTDLFAVDNVRAAVRQLYRGLDDQLRLADATTHLEEATYPIQDCFESRGFWSGNAMESQSAKIGFGTFEPNITVTQLCDGDDGDSSSIGNNPITRSRTNYEVVKPAFRLNNQRDDFDDPQREDYAVHLDDQIVLQDGVRMKRITPWQQEFSLSAAANFVSFRITNTKGVCEVRNIQFEESPTRTERTAG